MAEPRSLKNLARRPHKKVRTGCSNCKKRKVKCDEKKPACTHCIRQNILCDVVDVHTLLSLEQGAPPLDASPPVPSELNQLDLELMYHWTVSTHETISKNKHLCSFWRGNFVNVGLRSDFVMRGILSFAALHLAYLVPSRRSELTSVAIMHHDFATHKAMFSLSEDALATSSETKENVFAFSIMTIYYVLATAYCSNDQVMGSSPAEDPLSPDWMALFMGMSHFASISTEVDNRSSLLFPILHHMRAFFDYRERLTFPSCIPRLWAEIEALEADVSQEWGEIYMRAIRELDYMMMTFTEFPETRETLHAFTWLHMVADDLMHLVRRPCPPQAALAIFSYFCMTMDFLPMQWWMAAWADGVRRWTVDQLDEEHRAWVVTPRGWDVHMCDSWWSSQFLGGT